MDFYKLTNWKRSWGSELYVRNVSNDKLRLDVIERSTFKRALQKGDVEKKLFYQHSSNRRKIDEALIQVKFSITLNFWSFNAK